MIRGVVTADCETVIRLVVRGPAGQEQEVEAVVDTGFDGWFSLPPALIAQLELEWRPRGRAGALGVAAGVVLVVYAAVVPTGQTLPLASKATPFSLTVFSSSSLPPEVQAQEASTAPLVGMALLEGYELNVQVRNSGSVTIKALSSRRGA